MRGRFRLRRRCAATGPVGIGFGLFLRTRVGVGLLHRVVELLRVQTRLVERVAPTAVRQSQFGGDPHVLLGDGVGPAPRGVRGCGAREHQVGAHALDVERRTHRRDATQFGVG